MSNILTVYISQNEFSLKSFFESFVTCNVLTIIWVTNVNNFSVTIRYIIIIAIYVTMCLKNKTFIRTTQKHPPSFS